MRTYHKNVVRILLAAFFMLVLIGLAIFAVLQPKWLGNILPGSQAAAVAMVDLSSSGNFAILAGAGITNTDSTTVTGDVGSYATLTQTGFGPGADSVTFTGTSTNHFGDAITQTAKTALVTAYNFAAAEGPTSPIVADLGGQTLGPGIYNSASTIGLTGVLTLDGGNDPNAVFVFQAGSALTTLSGSSVNLINGAQACNVFWQVGSDATLGTGSTFRGTLMALSSITVTTGVTVEGRVLARNGAVTLDTNTIAVPATCLSGPILHVVKHVVNDNIGTSTASAWLLSVTSSNGGSGTGSAPGTELPGSTYTLQVGKAYSVAESGGPSGYSSSLSSDCTVASAVAGTIYTCTITNDDVAPASATLHIVKSVINVSGTASPPDFMVHVKSATSTLDVAGSPTAGTSTPGTLYTLSAGAYTVSEDSHPSFPSYDQTFGLDCVGGSFTLAPGEDKICTVINTDIPPPAPVVQSSGGGGGGSNAPIPLIKITKVPNPLALPGGLGSVTYTYTATNIGPIPMIGVWVKDDKCTPVKFISGDTNNNSKLDTGEAWVYRCTKTVSVTETNTTTAHGQAGGQDAYAAALATVVVGAPVPPPLINLIEVPSRLTPLSFGGDAVTYTYTVTNPGIVALHGVVVTDDKCDPVSYLSGDTNGDNLLDPSETWKYTCRTNVPISTRNVSTALGKANGLIALGYAFATVLVSAPGLPNTGVPPQGENAPLASPTIVPPSRNIIDDKLLAALDGVDLGAQVSAESPVHLKIPDSKVDSDLEAVRLTSKGAVGAPEVPSNAAWFNLSPAPGEIGSAVIVGHFGWKNGIPAVFDDLNKLQKGDKVYVENKKGATLTFVVREVRTYGENEDVSSVFSSSDGKAHLNLITCGGEWNVSTKSYSDRVVVFADEES